MPAEVQYVWTVERQEGFDVEQYASDVLENAKQCLKDDAFLQAAVFLVTDADIRCFCVGFEGYEEKEAAYKEVIRLANELKARFIVTLNDIYLGKNRYDPETYEWGQPAKDPSSREAIMVSVSGPGHQNYSKQVEYFRGPDGISFGANEEDCGGHLGMLQGWASNGEIPS